jgi:hypothetical protein
MRKSKSNHNNWAKSTGPKTPEGKARSAMNAFKHGRYAKSASVISIEDDIAFHELLDAYNAQFAPQTTVEARLVNEIAHIDWTLTRWRAIEIAQINRTFDLRDPDHNGASSIHDQVQLLTAALEASINESKFPIFINARIGRLLTERNSALRTLRTLRRTNPAPKPRPLHSPSDSDIFLQPHAPQKEPQSIEIQCTYVPSEPAGTYPSGETILMAPGPVL